MPIPIIYHHHDFLVINKPVGIGMHQEQDTSGIVEIMKQQLHIKQLWLVHRLDKVTSGCLILAKTAEAAQFFGDLFAQRAINKYYLAISDKKPTKKQGAIIGDMAKSRNGTYKLLRSKRSPAKSQFFSKGIAGQRAFVLKPTTGKTHQLRVALKSIGAAILGDTAYGGTPSDRCYLHAYGLDFVYRQGSVQIICPVVEGQQFQTVSFTEAMEAFSPPWTLSFPSI